MQTLWEASFQTIIKFKTRAVLHKKRLFFARAVDINEKAELIVVKDTGETLALNSGEVSTGIKNDN